MMTTGHFLTLFAAAGDWTQVIVPIVVFVIWLINQIANANKGNAPQGPKPQANRPAIPNPRQNRGPLEEVEQFLRDARKAMEGQQQQRPAQNAPRPAQQRPQQRAQTPKPPRLPKQQKKADKSPPRKPLSEQPRLRPQDSDRELDEIKLGGSVAQHVSEHLGAGSKFDERAGRLSHIQQSVDQDIGAHVKSAFDHQVGSLSQQGGGATLDAPALGDNPATSILALLRDPQGMRNAIILQEILQPPTHRW
jgi:hypothetical protein